MSPTVTVILMVKPSAGTMKIRNTFTPTAISLSTSWATSSVVAAECKHKLKLGARMVHDIDSTQVLVIVLIVGTAMNYTKD